MYFAFNIANKPRLNCTRRRHRPHEVVTNSDTTTFLLLSELSVRDWRRLGYRFDMTRYYLLDPRDARSADGDVDHETSSETAAQILCGKLTAAPTLAPSPVRRNIHNISVNCMDGHFYRPAAVWWTRNTTINYIGRVLKRDRTDPSDLLAPVRSRFWTQSTFQFRTTQ